jgi:rfaE bifunctional protein kinase chain/domain
VSGPDRFYREEAPRLCEIVGRFEDVAILLLADLVLDEFHHTEIARVSREAPVLIVEHRRLEAMPGGGANAANNVRALGGTALPVGVVGEDEGGARLLDLLRRAGIDTSGVAVVPGYETPCKRRVLAALPHSRPQQVVRIDRGSARSVEAAAARLAVERAEKLLPSTQGVLLSDYGYDLVRPDLTSRLIQEGRAAGLPVACDSRHRIREFRGVTAATPNLEEAEEVLGWRLGEEGTRLREAGQRLLAALGAREVLITRGARGMVLFCADEAPAEIEVFGSDQVADVTGAGDTVIATFTLALAAGAAPLEAALLANAAAGLAVMKRGTATVGARELTDAIRRAASGRG